MEGLNCQISSLYNSGVIPVLFMIMTSLVQNLGLFLILDCLFLLMVMDMVMLDF
jgi:hypothetical protein